MPTKVEIKKYPIPKWIHTASILLVLPKSISRKKTEVLVKNVVKQLYPQIWFPKKKTKIEISIRLYNLSVTPQKKIIERIHLDNNRLNKPYYKRQTIVVQKLTCNLELIVKDNITQIIFLRKKSRLNLVLLDNANYNQIKEKLLNTLQLRLARWLSPNAKTKTLHLLYYPLKSLKNAIATLKRGDWQKALGIFNQIIDRINFIPKKSLEELIVLGVCYHNRAVLLKSLGNHKVAKRDFYRAKNIMLFIEKE